MAGTPRGERARKTTAQRVAAAPAARVLLVEPAAKADAHADAALTGHGVECSRVHCAADALAAVTLEPFDLAVVDVRLPDADGLELAREIINQPGQAPCVILIADAPTLDDATDALRMGAADIVARPIDAHDLTARALRAIAAARAAREQTAEIVRLRRNCRRLNDARQQVTRQIDSLCNDLADAYQELAEQMSQVTLASEFTSMLRNELDVEALLRTSLEFILARSGPTNGAIFLPSNHCDFSLGAYVNYNFPKDTVDVLLDHLADVLAPRFQDENEVLRFTDDEAIAKRLGDDAHWLADSGLIVFSCRHEGECLAVVALFRDNAEPFADDLDAQLRIIGDVFAKQLARVIRIHHRHKPENAWPGFEEDDSADGGLAA
ncbi:MAG: response regulator [Phycisphaerales bacterium]|nr:MAG: response regulator [Phycisphaerales bacterium]